MKVHASSVGMGPNYPHPLAGRTLIRPQQKLQAAAGAQLDPWKIPSCGLHGCYEGDVCHADSEDQR